MCIGIPQKVLEIKNGDSVCFHWNQVCQKLSGAQRENLEKHTQRGLLLKT